eukprot:GHUV01013102.1.p2 GENE.GHUV01013102.1~~GHUV01013102.1.p2  ORF type:complete len:155 (+),score=27.26 GHUV01013102.1:394-858(+)
MQTSKEPGNQSWTAGQQQGNDCSAQAENVLGEGQGLLSSESSTGTGEVVLQGRALYNNLAQYNNLDSKLRHPWTGKLVHPRELCVKPEDYNPPPGYQPPSGTGPGLTKYTNKKFTEEIFDSIQPGDGLSEIEVKDLKDAYLGTPYPNSSLTRSS